MFLSAPTALYYGEQVVDDASLRAKIAEAAQANPEPELHLRADWKVAYEHVADLMSKAQSAGLSKIGFVTEPAH